MTLITLKPGSARLLISQREGTNKRRDESFKYLEEEISSGRWNDIPPIWITPKIIINGMLNFTIKPFIIYNGHHRFDKALEHNLPIRAYVRFTPSNPDIPEEEKLQYDIPY